MATGVAVGAIRLPDTEKVAVDVGRIDVLMRDGVHRICADLIRTIIRRKREGTLRTGVDRQTLDLSLRRHGRSDLEPARATNETLRIEVHGLGVIGDEVDPGLARDTLASLRVFGALQDPAAVTVALRDRIA